MIPRQEIAVPFCPLHGEYAPCLKCLVPEVADVVSESHNLSLDGVLFQETDLNEN